MDEFAVSKHMVVGLQSAGKTTFAAALWYLVDSKEAPTVLEKGKHRGDHSYLEMLAEEWADGWQVPRTKLQDHQNITMNLRDPATSQDISLQFFDMGGETFERAFATRVLTPEMVDAFEGTENLMVFVNAAQPPDDVTLIDIASRLQEDVDEASVADDAAQKQTFDPSKTPRQVQLVYFLQAIQEIPLSVKVRRIVVIISAWDKSTMPTEPDRWLEEHMPLLDQYLRNSTIEVRIYGVSAQGGDLPEKNDVANPRDREKLKRLAKASDRIQIVGYDVQKSDLTHPIRWLSGLEGV